MTTLLVDADFIAFRSAAAVERSIAWDDDIHTNHANLKDAREVFVDSIFNITKATSLHANVILCYSCPTRHYFRHDLLPSYKGNRKSKPPLVLKALKEWTMEEWEYKEKPHLEADDVMGIMATSPKAEKGTIIVSSDKDMLQIPGAHLDPLKLDEGVFEVGPIQAQIQLWMQVLMGDVTDNYTGCPGIGEVRAKKILEPDGRPYYQPVRDAYHKAIKDGDPDDYLTTQVNVARILQHDTYDYKRKEPKLWALPKS